MKSMAFRVCKQCTPPFVWEFLRRLIVGEQSKPVTYMGMYATFSDVSDNFPDTTNYHSEQSERVEIQEAKHKLENFEHGEVPEIGATLSRLNFLPTALSLSPRQTLAILDVGGGLGTTFIDLQFSLPTKDVVVTVVELPSVVEAAREILKQYSKVTFVSAFPQDRERYDVIYFGSSLQYFEDYISILQESMVLDPEYIVVADTTMGPAPTFVCAQVNMKGRAIPRLVFNRDELISTFAQRKFHLVHQSVNYSPSHTFDNYPPPARLTTHWNLIFRRNNQTMRPEETVSAA